MSEVVLLAIIFLFIFAVLFVIALALSPRLRAQIRLPFGMFFKIDAARPQPPSLKSMPQPRAAQASPATTDRRAWLAIKQRGRADWRYDLNGTAMVYVGRGGDNQVILAHDPAADTRHAVIYLEGGRYYINNLSARGTRVNSRAVAKQVLGDGNTIQMGNTKIIFHERR